MSWKLVAHARKPVVQQALATHETLDEWDPEIVLAGSEIAAGTFTADTLPEAKAEELRAVEVVHD